MMKRDELNSKKEKITDFKRHARNMKIIADGISKLPKGQLKKLLTDEVKNAFREEGVDI